MARKSVLGILLVAGVVAGCSAEPEAPAGPPVVQPGAPGDEPRVVASAAPDRGGASRVEVDYLRNMIAHHEQAVEMTALTPERAQNAKLRSLSDRIGGAQGPEIGMMRGWLSSHGAEHAGHAEHGGHDHATMPGMATPEQLARLAASRGADYDRLFLQLMIAHHEGALTMATQLLTTGRDEQVHEMAQDTLVTQQDEITTMRALQQEIG
ncbi:DUF305 domain-containing protein [Saccharopolyspora flava]|uniref:Uncharacterized conserved protein, DUF305 family n=1 Tax=Saccharopolyspora flava TaxID=95161 RepID=A0A1I6NWU4_9PSEU|nr:DUF305 domain-containing protein [Saccharopolyspora flava]SFS32437.1 Uncharacterized conserved protein, DUF305 family [Saccharopolyspora flava]